MATSKVLDLTKASNIAEQGIEAELQSNKWPNFGVQNSWYGDEVTEEKAEDADWPGRKFTKIWARIKADEKPNDTMGELELDDDLRRVNISRRKDPGDLLAKISAI